MNKNKHFSKFMFVKQIFLKNLLSFPTEERERLSSGLYG